MMHHIGSTILIFLFLASSFNSIALNPIRNQSNTNPEMESKWYDAESSFALHADSLHELSFRYNDRQRGISPWIAPVSMISGGTALYFMPAVNRGIRNFAQDNLNYHGRVEDFGQYAPLAAVYLLNITGIAGKNNFGNRSAIVVKSMLLSSMVTYKLKVWINETRPDGGVHSFPSGHTTTAFTFAQFMHREYGERNVWYSIGAYSGAATVGILRMAKNAHWISDVLAGAGIGMLSTELVYLTHQYKWDNEHIKRLDVFPFHSGKNKGLTLLYTF